MEKNQEKEEIIKASRELYMSKRRKKHIDNNVVVGLTCDGDKSNTEDNGNDSDLDSDWDSEDNLMIGDLQNAHHDKGANTSEIEDSGNKESEGKADEDLLSDYEREKRRKQRSGMV